MDETSLLVNKPLSLLIVVIANDGEVDAEGSLISVGEMYFFCRQARSGVLAISPIVCLENLIELFSDVFLDGLPIVDVGAAGFEDDEVIVQVD